MGIANHKTTYLYTLPSPPRRKGGNMWGLALLEALGVALLAALLISVFVAICMGLVIAIRDTIKEHKGDKDDG